MKLERAIAFLDLESTGIDPAVDRIVEFSFVVMEADFTIGKRWTRRVNPGMPIPAEATAVHGITDVDVAECPTFPAYATRIIAGLQGKDIAVYNGWRFDLPLLDEELRWCGHKLDLSGVNVIDCYQAFAKKHPRDLKAFVKQYAGREHEDSHAAEADVIGTADGFKGLLQQHEDLAAMTVGELAAFTRNGPMVDLAGKLRLDADGDICYAFGKHEGCKVKDQPSYAEWMLTKDFPGSTRDALKAILEGMKVKA